jgi:catalase (peroxidase I)
MHLGSSSRGLCPSLAISLERCGENGGGWLEGSEVDLIFTHHHDVRSTAEVTAMEKMRRKDICADIV